MQKQQKAILIGLALACLPLPLILNAGFFDFRRSFDDLVFLNGMLIGVPALFLLFGYRQAEKTQTFSRSNFIKAAAVVGICIGLFVVVPLAVPFIYLRPRGVPSHVPASQLIGVLSLTTAWSIFCASTFWGIAISPLLKKQSE